MPQPSPYDWRMARRISVLAAQSPGRGIRRADVHRRLGVGERDLRQYAMLAYSQGWIDFCRDFIVAAPRRP